MDKPKVFVTRPYFPGSGIELLKERNTNLMTLLDYNPANRGIPRPASFHSQNLHHNFRDTQKKSVTVLSLSNNSWSVRFKIRCEIEHYPFNNTIPEDYLISHITGSSALFCISTDKITKKVLDSAGPKLKVIATYSLGYEHIDVEECKKRNIQVCNAPNPVSVSVVAEFTVGLLLGVARKIVHSSGAIQKGEWTQQWDPDFYVGRGLTNATVGIVGMGRIGRAVLERLLPFGVSKAYYFDVFHPIPEAESLDASYASFEDLLRQSDFVIAMCNLTEQNRGLFNARAFSLMKPTSVFINTSRGGVVDQDALINALKNKQIKAAGIDVMYPEPLPQNHELVKLPNIVVTPHVAAAEEIALEELSKLTAENIIAVLEGRKPLTPVY